MTNPQLVVVAENETENPNLGRPLPVKLSRVVRYEGQPRRAFDQKSIEELAEAIAEEGQQTPIRVCKNSKQPGTFILIGGERRWRAFHVIQERTGKEPLIDCFIDVIHDERHHFRAAFLDNLQREDLIPLDEAAAYQQLYDDSHETSHRAKILEIVRYTKKSESHVESYLALNKLGGGTKELMDITLPKNQRLSVTTAIDIARSTTDPKLQFELAKESVDRDLGVAEARVFIGFKTGKSGFGIGGRLRKPSDDYKMLKVFLGHTASRSKRYNNVLHVGSLYRSRDDEFGDRKRDAELIRGIIQNFKQILKEIEEDG